MMRVRILVSYLLLTAWLSFPAIVKAEQEQKPTGPPTPAATDPVTRAELNAAIAKIENRLNSQNKMLAKILGAMPQPKPSAAAEASPTGRVTRGEFDALTVVVSELEARQNHIAKRVSQPDSQDMYVLNIAGNMQQSPEFRREIARAVHDSLRKRGTLRVQNRMATDRYLRVNNRQYRIPASKTIEIDVPVGTVTTELAGYERPKNWSVGPPNYVQEIFIAGRAAPPVIVSPPVIVDPIVWVW